MSLWLGCVWAALASEAGHGAETGHGAEDAPAHGGAEVHHEPAPTKPAPPPKAAPAPKASPAKPAPDPVAAAPAAHGAEAVVDPVMAIADLVAGNKRFMEGTAQHPGASPADRTALAAGQHPHTMVLTCADSRVSPELLFDQGLGELFVVRSAGNSVDEHLVASLEYAASHLGPRLLVILGHTSCGAVKAAIGTPWGKSAGSPALDDLVHDIQLCMGPVTPAAAADPTVRDAVWANVRGVRSMLLAESAILQTAVSTGQVEVRAAVYDLETGQVVFDRAQPSVALQGPAPAH